MGKKLFVFILFIVLSVYNAEAQKYILDFDKTPLNKVLLSLRSRYGMHFSFDDNLLSQYIITAHAAFADKEKAVEYLLKDLPLGFEEVENVFLIYPVIQSQADTGSVCLFSGYVFERGSGEPLPYSHVLVNGKALVSDLTGFFSGHIPNDTVYRVRVSHLGYYLLDTLLLCGGKTKLYLSPSAVKLHEVEIKSTNVDYRSQTGQLPGIIRLNSKVATHLPGFGDNSVFNLLRLQPGILASGEQTNELIIWGGYAGQSKVLFDGFTVYGLKNFNDNISSFNPLMAKDIEVMKGGFDARYGERVGGIVQITGKNGNTRNLSFTVNINNMTVNTIVEIPVIKQRSSLVIALRHTYFNLYNPTDYTVNRTDSTGNSKSVDIHIVPDYVFRDLNIKYSGKTKSDDLYFISLYSGNDNFTYNIDQRIYFRRILKKTTEENLQFGGSLFYGKSWKNGWSENFELSVSSLKENYYDRYRIVKLWNYETDTVNWASSYNRMTETHLHTAVTSPLTPVHTIEWGGGIIGNNSSLQADTFGIVMPVINMQGSRMYIYFQDKMTPVKGLVLRFGGRINYAVNLDSHYFEPRFSGTYTPAGAWKINFAAGLYNQFVVKSSVLDSEGNYRYLWAVCDNEAIPVVHAAHLVLGGSYFKNNWSLSVEWYYKSLTGLSRFVKYRDIIAPGIYHGNGYGFGVDLMIKKDIRGSSFWVAYSAGKTMEHFDYFVDDRYKRAPQDQRHELKLAAMTHLGRWYFSANYVYGSGFPVTYNQQQRIEPDYPYSRLDAALAYRFLNKKLKGEAGISLLNILNTENIKFSNFERVPINQTASINIYAQAIPFTPTIYLNISL